MASNKPNMKEFMDATGVDAKAASEILYGTIGANKDTRDWDAIMASDDPVETSIQANLEQYSSGAATQDTDRREYDTYVNPVGDKAGIVKTDTGYALVSSDGIPLRAGFNSLEQAQDQGKYFGISEYLGDSYVIGRAAQPSSGGGSGAVSGGQPAVVDSGPAADMYQPFTGQTPDPISQTVDDAITQQTVMPTYTGGSTTSTEVVAKPELGTISSPLQTANLSAVPETFTYRPNYTGTTMANLTMPSQAPSEDQQQQYGVQNALYKNNIGQSLYVTEINGQPTTYVPPGFTKAAAAAKGGMMRNGYAEGGMPEDPMLEAKYRIATMNGYNGPKTNASLNNFANSSEGMKRKFNAIGTMMSKGGLAMAQGGTVPRATTIENQPHRLAYINPQEEQLLRQRGGTGQPGPGGIPAFANEDDPTVANTATNQPGPFEQRLAQMDESLITQTMQPRQAPVSYITPQAADFVAPTAGQTVPQAPYAEAAKVGTVEQAMLPDYMSAATMQPTAVTPAVQQETAQLQAAQGTVTPQAQIQAAQQQQTSMAGLEAAQGTAYMISNPVQREIQQGELISGAADAEKAAQFNEQIQAATATPTKQATVQGQLEGLMQQFEGGETPAWAAGSMRTAMATLSARGLGASSMAGQAVIQATMEAALPIAQMDAQTTAQFEAQNLSNRQQRAMLAAQQRAQFLGQEFDQAFQARVQNSARIGDIANMNFTAEQQVALENSRAANTMNLNNLSNRQAMVMAEAAALSNLDMANLNNRQQAAVQNAQNFMQMDMANLSNTQQTLMFKSQQNLQALFTDQAAENAAAQFNATSENQTNQFFSNLSNQTSQFNAAQRNAMDQFNVNSVNALREFNSEIQQQRDLFNAQNGLVVAQANAQWRQKLATANTAAQNESNMLFARDMNQLTTMNLDSYWQRERDIMSYAFQTANNNADRATAIFKQQLVNDAEMDEAKASKSASMAKAAAALAEKVLFG